MSEYLCCKPIMTCLSLILCFTLFPLQKMTWKSRQADVDTCRMKGKHKVEKNTQTHSMYRDFCAYTPTAFIEQMSPCSSSRSTSSESHVIQCRHPATNVIFSQLLCFPVRRRKPCRCNNRRPQSIKLSAVTFYRALQRESSYQIAFLWYLQ